MSGRPGGSGRLARTRSIWREWLLLSNLLAFKPIGLMIGSVISTFSAGGSVEEEAARLELSDGLNPAWHELLEQATEFDKTLLLAIANADIRVLPELGFEVDGLPVSIAWPDYRIAVVLDGDDGRTELEAAGWAAVGTDVDDIRELLKTKGA
ncbi:hypothetical protein ACFRJ8_20970 [Arthrobacter sp. NPDC056886]|uniref:hypothetical protein n=1 Tax=Arthrobacter sp. NPDC056886 TaxID=3345960 RepID=UPI003672236E